jgi:hypothetical protein
MQQPRLSRYFDGKAVPSPAPEIADAQPKTLTGIQHQRDPYAGWSEAQMRELVRQQQMCM